jgi:putative salt-induced outer membrane protein
MKKILLSSVIASAVALSAQAADANTLVTHTEMGYIQTDGNTKTKTFNVDAKASKTWNKNVGTLKIDGQYADADGKETKNKYLIEGNYDYKITEKFAFNYLVGYKSDRYAGFAYQTYTGPGAKYQAIKTDNHNLSVDGNILYSSDKSYATKDTNNYSAYRVQAIYAWQMLKNLKFDQEASFRGSFEDSSNYFAYSKTALTSKLSDIFSAGISYKVDYVNQPLAAKTTDSTLTFNLIMDY